jgi:hypothetical protein
MHEHLYTLVRMLSLAPFQDYVEGYVIVKEFNSDKV